MYPAQRTGVISVIIKMMYYMLPGMVLEITKIWIETHFAVDNLCK